MVNAFPLLPRPNDAVPAHCDAHVPKVGVEAAQMLSAVLRHLGWHHVFEALGDERDAYVLHKPTHLKHPQVFWAQASTASAEWLAEYGVALAAQYEARYRTEHPCLRLLKNIQTFLHTVAKETDRPRSLDAEGLREAMRAFGGDAYLEKHGHKIVGFRDCLSADDQAALPPGHVHAGICNFAIRLPGSTPKEGRALTARLYEVCSTACSELDPNRLCAFYRLYYACKAAIGFGDTKCRPVAWWGYVGCVPSLLLEALVVAELVVPDRARWACRIGVRRLPTTRCATPPTDLHHPLCACLDLRILDHFK